MGGCLHVGPARDYNCLAISSSFDAPPAMVIMLLSRCAGRRASPKRQVTRSTFSGARWSNAGRVVRLQLSLSLAGLAERVSSSRGGNE
jgi:hypothetical protein